MVLAVGGEVTVALKREVGNMLQSCSYGKTKWEVEGWEWNHQVLYSTIHNFTVIN